MSSTSNQEQLSAAEHDSVLIRVRWKVRLVVVLTILILSFIGIIIATINPSGSWLYWRVIVHVMAILSLWLTWYMRRNLQQGGVGFWRVFIHWLGVLVTIYVLAALVDIGVVGNLAAGMVGMELLGLSFYLAGIYIDISYVFIGITLAVFALADAFLSTYLPILMLPLVIVVALIVWYVVLRTRPKLN